MKLELIILNLGLTTVSSSQISTSVDSSPQATPEGHLGPQSKTEAGPSSGSKSPIGTSQSLYTSSIFEVGRGNPPAPLFSSSLLFRNLICSSLPLLSTPSNPTVLASENATNNKITLKPKINFPNFDVADPRSWLRKCEKFFELYNIPEHEKLSYALVHLGEKVDVWFDSYMVIHRGRVTWPKFCVELCRRFGSVSHDIVDEFNKLVQTGSVDQYHERFEELMSYMSIINPLLNEAHFVVSYISGLKMELKPLVKLANPSTAIDAYETAKLYEDLFKALLLLILVRPQSTFTPNLLINP